MTGSKRYIDLDLLRLLVREEEPFSKQAGSAAIEPGAPALRVNLGYLGIESLNRIARQPPPFSLLAEVFERGIGFISGSVVNHRLLVPDFAGSLCGDDNP